MKKVLLIIFIIFIAGSLIGVGYILYNKAKKDPVVYETTEPFVTNIIKKTVATGTIMPRKEIEIKSQVPGVVEKLFVEAGESVKQGDLIAKIKIIPDVVSLNRAEADLQTAIINFNNAKKEMERQEKLYEEKVISQFDYNQFVLDFKLRKQDMEAAEANLELVKEGASKKSGNVSNLVYSTVDGMVLDVPVEEGNFIVESNSFNEGTTIASVANMNEMIFEGMLDESEVGKVKEGMNLNLKIGAIDDATYNAILEFVSPKGIEEEGAIKFEVKANIKLKEDQFLRAGYSANADIVLDQRDSVLAIKERDIDFQGDTAFVEIETSDQIFEKRRIATGLSDGINIEVLKGLEKKDKIKKG